MDFKLSILSILVAASLSGCAGDVVSNLVKLPTGEIVSAATDRFGSWERVEIKKADVKISENELEKAKLEKQAVEVKPQVIIDSADELAIYKDMEAVRILGEANKTLGLAVVALAEKDKVVVSDSTPFPKGAFAEFMESTGKGIKDAGNTPATMILSTGQALGSFMGAVDQGAKVDSGGGDVSIVTEKTVSTSSGTESAVANYPDQANVTTESTEVAGAVE